MKLVARFFEFLRTTVNLNHTRLDTLEYNVDSIESFLKDSNWQPRIWRFERQGSWAAKTIIKPVEGCAYDADLLVLVAPVDGWDARDYVNQLYDVFAESGRYSDKAQRHDYCVTIDYAGEQNVDIAPCVRARVAEHQHEVCNRRDNMFVRSEPTTFTDWLKERNSWSGNDSFRKCTRLIKYLRDITNRFNCPSVLLTTMLGNQMYWNDKGSDEFSDVPTALQTLFGRLDDWMQANPNKPTVWNPSYNGENFADLLTERQYETLRDTVNKLRGDIDTAYETEGVEASIEAWRKVFGEQFAKGYTVVSKADLAEDYIELQKSFSATAMTANHDSSIVDHILTYGKWFWSPDLDRPPHMMKPLWKPAAHVSSDVQVVAKWQEHRNGPDSSAVRIPDFKELPPKGGLWFDARVHGGASVPEGHYVRWRITNTGRVALAIGKGRGGFETPQLGNKRWEALEYRGVHLAEAFIIRRSDDRLVGQSPPFHVMIE